MAKRPNYGFVKRQKELQRQQRKEEKAEKRRQKADSAPGADGDVPGESAGEDPGSAEDPTERPDA